MNRRALAVAAATAGLVLAPTAAMADYADEEAYLELSAVTEGEFATLTATVFAADEYEDGEEVTLTITSASDSTPDSAIEIAGTAASSEVIADGSAVFDVGLGAADTYEFVATDSDGEYIDSAELEIVPVDGGEGDDGDMGGLPETGTNSTPLIIGAAALLAAGAGAMVFARSRQKA